MLQLDAAFAAAEPGPTPLAPQLLSRLQPAANWHWPDASQLLAQGAPRQPSSGTDSSSAASAAVLFGAAVLGAARARRRHRQCRSRGVPVIRWAAKAPAAPPITQEERQQLKRSSGEGSGRGRQGGERLKRRLEDGGAGEGGKGGGKGGKGEGKGGTFTSPWTGKVYDRYAPIGLAPKGEENYRASGLGVARAYETPMQKKINGTTAQGEAPVEEWQKYYPGLEPEHAKPEHMRTKQPKPAKEPRPYQRHAYHAGNFADLFKQVVLNTVLQLKLRKDKPMYYVETCTGEGEYHANRLRPVGMKPNMAWPTAEDLYDALKDLDITYLPPELREWTEAVTALNETGDFELKRAGVSPDGIDEEVIDEEVEEEPDNGGRITWLPSSTYLALRQLRAHDPVLLFEDTHVCFAALLNFMRNWSDTLKPHVELSFKDGFKEVKNLFVKRYYESKAHGKFKGGRGLVFVDSFWNRGSEIWSCQAIINSLRKHWRASTVMVAYQLGPNSEPKARRFNRNVLDQAEVPLDLLMVEMYVDNSNWHEESREPKWRGAGMLISTPPMTTAERAKAALEVMAQELGKQPGAQRMRVRVESLT